LSPEESTYYNYGNKSSFVSQNQDQYREAEEYYNDEEYDEEQEEEEK
jgi:hypothetical protein